MVSCREIGLIIFFYFLNFINATYKNFKLFQIFLMPYLKTRRVFIIIGADKHNEIIIVHCIN